MQETSSTDGDGTTEAAGARPGAPLAAVRSRKAVATLLGTGFAVVTVDVITKIIVVAHLSDRAPIDLVPGVLDLRLTRNPGAAFSLAGGATVLFSLVAVAVVAVIARTARTLKSTPWAIVLGLLLGGALGNLTDRIFRAPAPLRGHVVDWIHLHHWPVFNVADSAIVIGGILAVILGARGIGLDGQRATDAGEQ
ncbi:MULTISPECIES: signal peptidase II [unclassified Frankia]|uniref:signal peptidase II n=1 Tax=unclassified Frankia TaxID=2632575 RepID=UPI002AD51062|nr:MULTISPECIES: signal peptidase II [unclassified Frankia]